MSVSRKVLRRMKKVMGVIGTSAVLVPCSSQISFAEQYKWSDERGGNNVQYDFDSSTKTLTISGTGVIFGLWNNFEHDVFRAEENLEKVVISEGIQGIGPRAFLFGGKVNSLVLPSSMVAICDSAFSGCKELKSIENNMSKDAYIAKNAFVGCEKIDAKKYLVNNGEERPVFIFDNTKGTLFVLGNGSITQSMVRSSLKDKKIKRKYVRKLVIADNINKIDSGCFNMLRFSEVYIKDCVFTAGNGIFYGCKKLEKFDMTGCGVVKIGNSCFFGCTNLKNVELDMGHKGTLYVGKDFFDKNTKLEKFCAIGVVFDEDIQDSLPEDCWTDNVIYGEKMQNKKNEK